MINYSENNIITLVGTIVSERTFSHEVYGEGFYSFNLEVPRLSENSDIIPVTVSERILSDEFKMGEKVVIDEDIRQYEQELRALATIVEAPAMSFFQKL